MGAVRTTFAMVAACIIRRKQLIMHGMDDPYVSKALVPKLTTVSVCVFFDVPISSADPWGGSHWVAR